MANLQHFPLPDVGEGLTEAEILNWRVQPGDQVEVNQVIVEIETAKAAVELPCPWAGTVRELLAEPGQTVEVGTPIVAIDVAGEVEVVEQGAAPAAEDRKSTRLNSSHVKISYAVFCLKKKNTNREQ